jgi:hypothetical protein
VQKVCRRRRPGPGPHGPEAGARRGRRCLCWAFWACGLRFRQNRDDNKFLSGAGRRVRRSLHSLKLAQQKEGGPLRHAFRILVHEVNESVYSGLTANRCLVVTMRITKNQQSWLGYAAVLFVVLLIASAFSARKEFVEYKWLQKSRLEQTAAILDEDAVEAAGRICFALRAEQKAKCVEEYRQMRVADLRSQADLAAQQDMALWSLGALIVGLFALTFNAGGFLALVWTFRETRKMTEAQDRAYLIIGASQIFQDPTYGLTYGLEVRNFGNTPAASISAKLVLSITFPDPNDHTEALVETYKISDVLDEVPAKASGHLHSGHLSAILSLPEALLVSHGSHYRKTGTIIGTGEIEEDGVDARIDVSGTVTYFDVFGGQHILQVRQYSMSLDDDGWSLRDTTSSLRFVRESEF